MAAFSARNLLTGFDEQLRSSLIPRPAARAARALAQQLPALGSAQYFELRLGENAPPRVDLLVAISRLERDLLKHCGGDYRTHGAGLAAFGRALSGWTDKRSRLYEAAPTLWLEFDDLERQIEPTANVCVTVVPSYIDPFSPLVSMAPAELLATLLDCIELVRGLPSDERERSTLDRCVSTLPLGAHWIHVSMMTARTPQAVKLYGVFRRDTLIPYLRTVGWAGNIASIEDLLARYAGVEGVGNEVYVDLSVSELVSGASASLGICFSKQHLKHKGHRDPRRLELLGALVAGGLCSRAQAQALSLWPTSAQGQSDTTLGLDRWFEIKLVHQTEQPQLAKAYLGFAMRSNSARPGL